MAGVGRLIGLASLAPNLRTTLQSLGLPFNTQSCNDIRTQPLVFELAALVRPSGMYLTTFFNPKVKRLTRKQHSYREGISALSQEGLSLLSGCPFQFTLLQYYKMISDDGLNSLAIFLGSLSMLLIVLYHFLEVNAKDDGIASNTEKLDVKAEGKGKAQARAGSKAS